MQVIPKDQILRRLAAENPWWQSPHQVQRIYDRWTPRPYLELFYPLAANRNIRRAVVLLGPRRVGKTVMLHHAVQRLLADGVPPRRICYLSVDHPLYHGLSLETLLELYREAAGVTGGERDGFLLLDEIQYLKGWEVHLKALVDSYPSLKCVASGSAAAALHLQSRESGAGRFTNFLLPPLTFYEYLVLRREERLVGQLTAAEPVLSSEELEDLNRAFLHYLNFGGYPEVVLSPEIQEDPGRFVKDDIVDKVLLRDLPSLYGIQDTQELNSLFTTLAFNTAQEVSLEQLAQRSGVAKGTLRSYIEYLEAAFLIRTVRRVDKNARHFERAVRFKVYLANPSIRSALFSPLQEEDEAMGNLVETAIFAQWFHWPDLPLYYARWDKGEVDLVHLGPDQRIDWADEVKWSDRIVRSPDDLREVISFCHEHSLHTLTVTTRSAAEVQTLRNVTVRFVPAAVYCFLVGYGGVRTRGGNPLPPLPVS
ncbi:MAG TPA: ATP-binding protein [Thermoanaerobaculia bacterium]|nr:ATP-binding protein [Thermoanaerobaculia bacterium]